MAQDRLIIVDGYNLILRSSALKPGEGRTLRESREKLVNLLSWAIGSAEAQFLVVFDGAEGGRDQGPGRVEVRFSRPPESADDLIRALVEERFQWDAHARQLEELYSVDPGALRPRNLIDGGVQRPLMISKWAANAIADASRKLTCEIGSPALSLARCSPAKSRIIHSPSRCSQ